MPFWLLIFIISFPYCSVLSLLAHPPTDFLPPLFTLPSGAPVLLHIMFLTPPGLNWKLALSQGHHFPGRGCLFSCIFFFSPILCLKAWRDKLCSTFSGLFLKHWFNPSSKISLLASAVLLYPLNSFSLSSVDMSWSLTHRFCHISESSVCSPMQQWCSHHLTLTIFPDLICFMDLAFLFCSVHISDQTLSFVKTGKS